MATPHIPTPPRDAATTQVLNTLHEALANAVDNLAAVAADDPQLAIKVSADIAALQHLVTPDPATGYTPLDENL